MVIRVAEIYKNQGMDLRKLWLCAKKKIWIPFAALLLGCVLGGLSYLLYHAVHDGVSYQAISKVYLDFAQDETGEVYQYYNGYTWNDLMSTEPIITETMKALEGTAIDMATVEASTEATILSDIRLLTITITADDATVCEQIQSATEQSLEALGDSAKEFIDIRVVKSVSPVRIYVDNRCKQAVLLGAILGLLVAVIGLSLYYVLDDYIYVPRDLTDRYKLPFLGICLAKEEAVLTDKMEESVSEYGKACKENLSVFLKNSKMVLIDAEDFCKKKGSLLLEEPLMDDAKIVIAIPAGQVSAASLDYLLKNPQLTDREAQIGLVITKGDQTYFDQYFRWNKEKKGMVG